MRCVKPAAFVDDVLQVEHIEVENQKEDIDLMVGEDIKKLLEECTVQEKMKFYANVRKFYVIACDYAKSKLPLSDEALLHSEVLDVNRKEESSFASVKFFVERFPCLLQGDPPCSVDVLEEEFCLYRIDHDFPDEIMECDRIDKQCYLIGQLKDSNGVLKYRNLAQVMKGVLSVPHSNTDCERVISLIVRIPLTLDQILGTRH